MNEDLSHRRRARPEDAGGVDGRPKCPAAARAESLDFGLDDLPGVRDHVAARARGAGMAEEAVGDLLVAVNEVATNAVTHGSIKAWLGIRREGMDLVVAVHDDGRDWRFEGEPGHDPPPENATSGMGLWVARLLSDDLHVTTGPGGTTVTMRFLLE